MEVDNPHNRVSLSSDTQFLDLDDQDIFDETANLEARFYREGYDAGHAHGRLHGLFEGRALGQEKAWEIWEEVGFYEGFAEMWSGILSSIVVGSKRGKEAKAAQHARQLLDLISTFPTLNPTPTPNESITSTISPITNQDDSTQPHSQSLSQSQSDNTDLPQLVSSIRARYRLLCTSLGVRPRLVAAASADLDAGAMADNEPTSGIEGRRNDGAPVVLAGVVQGIEGPMKGVDTRQLRF